MKLSNDEDKAIESRLHFKYYLLVSLLVCGFIFVILGVFVLDGAFQWISLLAGGACFIFGRWILYMKNAGPN